MRNQVVRHVSLDGSVENKSAEVTWSILSRLNGREVVVKLTKGGQENREFPSQFSIRGKLEIGDAQARILNRHLSDDDYVYFEPGDVEAFVEGRLSDRLAGIHLSF